MTSNCTITFWFVVIVIVLAVPARRRRFVRTHPVAYAEAIHRDGGELNHRVLNVAAVGVRRRAGDDRAGRGRLDADRQDVRVLHVRALQVHGLSSRHRDLFRQRCRPVRNGCVRDRVRPHRDVRQRDAAGVPAARIHPPQHAGVPRTLRLQDDSQPTDRLMTGVVLAGQIRRHVRVASADGDERAARFRRARRAAETERYLSLVRAVRPRHRIARQTRERHAPDRVAELVQHLSGNRERRRDSQVVLVEPIARDIAVIAVGGREAVGGLVRDGRAAEAVVDRGRVVAVAVSHGLAGQAGDGDARNAGAVDRGHAAGDGLRRVP